VRCARSDFGLVFLFGAPPNRFDHIERTPADFVVDPSYVFADDPDGHEQRSDEEEEDREQREDTLDLRSDEETTQKQEESEGQTGERREDAEERDELDRQHGESGQKVEAKTHQTEHVVARAAENPLLVRHRYLGYPFGEPCRQRGDEKRVLAPAQHALHDLPSIGT